MKIRTVAALLLAPAVTSAGPKWDATVKQCDAAYDLFYKPNVGNSALLMNQASTPAQLEQLCEQAGASFQKRTDFAALTPAGGHYTAAMYGDLAGLYAALACTKTNEQHHGSDEPVHTKAQLTEACLQRLRTSGVSERE